MALLSCLRWDVAYGSQLSKPVSPRAEVAVVPSRVKYRQWKVTLARGNHAGAVGSMRRYYGAGITSPLMSTRYQKLTLGVLTCTTPAASLQIQFHPVRGKHVWVTGDDQTGCLPSWEERIESRCAGTFIRSRTCAFSRGKRLLLGEGIMKPTSKTCETACWLCAPNGTPEKDGSCILE